MFSILGVGAASGGSAKDIYSFLIKEPCKILQLQVSLNSRYINFILVVSISH